MINLAEVITDPDFCQDFIVYRSNGSFVDGRWTEGTPTTITMTGIIQVASEKELVQIPEGDQIQGAMVFYSTQPFALTHTSKPPGISDKAMFRGEYYKLYQDADWGDYGFYKAIGARTQGS